jgi:vacuolar-type H+-ATPase subunit I/STV1
MHERGFNDGFHINNRDEAIVLCDLLNNMERELAEAKFDLQFRRELYALQTKELGEAREQRDRLAEALQSALNEIGDAYLACEVEVREALDAVKGVTP